MTLIWLACLIAITLLAFRRQDQIRDLLDDQSQQWLNETVSPTSIHEKAEIDEVTLGRKAMTGVRQKPITKGPVLGNGERSLSDRSLTDLWNKTLGVRSLCVTLAILAVLIQAPTVREHLRAERTKPNGQARRYAVGCLVDRL